MEKKNLECNHNAIFRHREENHAVFRKWMQLDGDMMLNELGQYQEDNMFSTIYGPKTLYSHLKTCILYKMKVFREIKVINRKEGERKRKEEGEKTLGIQETCTKVKIK